MNKNELKAVYSKFLEDFSMSANEVVISAGSGLLMYGLRSVCSDIDIDVSEVNYDRLLAEFKAKGTVFEKVATYQDKEDVQYFDIEGSNLSFHKVKVIPEFIEINGVSVYTLAELLKQKESLLFLGRNKDVVDIEGIKALMTL